jgi:hypothetical protein
MIFRNRTAITAFFALAILCANAVCSHAETETKNRKLTKEQKKEILDGLPEGARLVTTLVYLTAYAGPDNSPPGSDEISQPPFHANLGDGSFDNPTTLAVNPKDGKFVVPYGTMIHIPDIGWTKAEDLCGMCVEQKDLQYRVDLWLGMDATPQDESDITGWYWSYFLVIENPDN